MKKTIIIISILSICCVIFGFLVSMNQPPYRIEGKKEIYIKNQSEFIEYTKNYDSYERAYLATNITIEKDFISMGQKEKLFNGIFDGCGYSISFKNRILNTSLFNIIGEEGIVKNLELIIEDAIVNLTSFGLIANQNKGTINNVIVKVKNITILKDTMLGCIVGLNQGTISFCYVEGTINNNITLSRRASIISGCCGFNDGLVSSVITNINYENFEEVKKEKLLEGTINNSYGTICGINNKQEEGIKNSYYFGNEENVFSDNQYITRIETLTEEILLNKYLFNNKLWNLTIDNSKINISLEDGVTI